MGLVIFQLNKKPDCLLKDTRFYVKKGQNSSEIESYEYRISGRYTKGIIVKQRILLSDYGKKYLGSQGLPCDVWFTSKNGHKLYCEEIVQTAIKGTTRSNISKPRKTNIYRVVRGKLVLKPEKEKNNTDEVAFFIPNLRGFRGNVYETYMGKVRATYDMYEMRRGKTRGGTISITRYDNDDKDWHEEAAEFIHNITHILGFVIGKMLVPTIERHVYSEKEEVVFRENAENYLSNRLSVFKTLEVGELLESILKFISKKDADKSMDLIKNIAYSCAAANNFSLDYEIRASSLIIAIERWGEYIKKKKKEDFREKMKNIRKKYKLDFLEDKMIQELTDFRNDIDHGRKVKRAECMEMFEILYGVFKSIFLEELELIGWQCSYTKEQGKPIITVTPDLS